MSLSERVLSTRSKQFLQVKGLAKSYKTPDGKLEILRGIDLELKEGGLYFIVGKSGSGKSTLLHILGGLDNPTDGTVSYDGVNLFKLREGQIARYRNQTFGFVFQFFHLLPELTLFENILLPSLILGKKAETRARELIQALGLKGRESHYPSQLSGGEQQRVAIARALLNEPKIVFCDEPTGNLDEETGEQIRRVIQDLHQKKGITFLIVTHDEELTQGATQVFKLHEGRLHIEVPGTKGTRS